MSNGFNWTAALAGAALVPAAAYGVAGLRPVAVPADLPSPEEAARRAARRRRQNQQAVGYVAGGAALAAAALAASGVLRQSRSMQSGAYGGAIGAGLLALALLATLPPAPAEVPFVPPRPGPDPEPAPGPTAPAFVIQNATLYAQPNVGSAPLRPLPRGARVEVESAASPGWVYAYYTPTGLAPAEGYLRIEDISATAPALMQQASTGQALPPPFFPEATDWVAVTPGEVRPPEVEEAKRKLEGAYRSSVSIAIRNALAEQYRLARVRAGLPEQETYPITGPARCVSPEGCPLFSAPDGQNRIGTISATERGAWIGDVRGRWAHVQVLTIPEELPTLATPIGGLSGWTPIEGLQVARPPTMSTAPMPMPMGVPLGGRGRFFPEAVQKSIDAVRSAQLNGQSSAIVQGLMGNARRAGAAAGIDPAEIDRALADATAAPAIAVALTTLEITQYIGEGDKATASGPYKVPAGAIVATLDRRGIDRLRRRPPQGTSTGFVATFGESGKGRMTRRQVLAPPAIYSQAETTFSAETMRQAAVLAPGTEVTLVGEAGGVNSLYVAEPAGQVNGVSSSGGGVRFSVHPTDSSKGKVWHLVQASVPTLEGYVSPGSPRARKVVQGWIPQDSVVIERSSTTTLPTDQSVLVQYLLDDRSAGKGMITARGWVRSEQIRMLPGGDRSLPELKNVDWRGGWPVNKGRQFTERLGRVSQRPPPQSRVPVVSKAVTPMSRVCGPAGCRLRATAGGAITGTLPPGTPVTITEQTRGLRGSFYARVDGETVRGQWVHSSELATPPATAATGALFAHVYGGRS